MYKSVRGKINLQSQLSEETQKFLRYPSRASINLIEGGCLKISKSWIKHMTRKIVENKKIVLDFYLKSAFLMNSGHFISRDRTRDLRHLAGIFTTVPRMKHIKRLIYLSVVQW